jgi:hypothetical protein
MQVMHLNKDYRHPDQGPLFDRSSVTAEVEAIMPQVPQRIADELAVLAGSQPERGRGTLLVPRQRVRVLRSLLAGRSRQHRQPLERGPKRMLGWYAKGVRRMKDLPEKAKLNDKQQRQLRAQRENTLIVERGLAEAMQPAIEAKRLGFLDFETGGARAASVERPRPLAADSRAVQLPRAWA